MALETVELGQGRRHGVEGLPIIDCDFHNSTGGGALKYLPERWRDYLATVGRRNADHYGSTTQQRPLACRLDSFPAGGGPPGSDRDLAREQLLDEYGLAGAVINNLECAASGNSPVEFEIAHARATNDFNMEEWFTHDERWLASINVSADHPEAAAAEIARCAEASDRFVQVIIGSRTERPAGNPKYWPIYEVAVHYDLPVAFHVANCRYNNWTGVGPTDYYYEMHTLFPLPTQAMMASMIFEGLFERWPQLKIVATELGWEWAVPFAWRLDASWRVLRGEVPQISAAPSEYVKRNFWFSTQPCVEPEDPGDITGVYEQFVDFGLGGHLLFATDYPHWDMDSPFEAVPPLLSREAKAEILAGAAEALLGLELNADGVAVRAR